MRRRPGSLFAPGLSLWIFSRDILFRLYRKVSYPSFTPHQAQGTYAIRQESEKRAGEYRENGAREDRDPLQISPMRVYRHPVLAMQVAYHWRLVRFSRSTKEVSPDEQAYGVRETELVLADNLVRVQLLLYRRAPSSSAITRPHRRA
jgi:hypothetical protein